MDVKPALSIENQIKRLKSRNLLIEDEQAAAKELLSINYYRLSAFLLPFEDKDKNIYSDDISFNKVLNIYHFDRKIRNLIMAILDSIEIDLRSKIAYEHSMNHGPLGYMDKINFSNKNNFEQFEETIKKYKVREQKNVIIEHHKEKYDGDIPLWVMIEFFSFSELSKFYNNMLTPDQKKVGTHYMLNNRILASWFYCLTILRNKCAHQDRVYYYNFIPTPVTPKKLKSLGRTLKNTLFDYFFTLKNLVNKSLWKTEFFPRLETLINEYQTSIDLNHIGFISDWKTILL